MTGALAALHSHEVIHRDITPRSFIVRQETDEVKLTDFGLASR